MNADVDPRVARGLKGWFCDSCLHRLRVTPEANTPSGAVENRWKELGSSKCLGPIGNPGPDGRGLFSRMLDP
jgi:hypothetical protein